MNECMSHNFLEKRFALDEVYHVSSYYYYYYYYNYYYYDYYYYCYYKLHCYSHFHIKKTNCKWLKQYLLLAT